MNDSMPSRRRVRGFLAALLILGCGADPATVPTTCNIQFEANPADPLDEIWVSATPVGSPEGIPGVPPVHATRVGDVAGPAGQYRCSYEVALPLYAGYEYTFTVSESERFGGAGEGFRSVNSEALEYGGQESFDAGLIDLQDAP